MNRHIDIHAHIMRHTYTCVDTQAHNKQSDTQTYMQTNIDTCKQTDRGICQHTDTDADTHTYS